MEKVKLKLQELEAKKQQILTDLKEGKTHISVDSIIKIGQELELIRVKIWTIEEIIKK